MIPILGMNNNNSSVEEFRVQLQKLDADFICNTPLPNNFAFVSFLGPFNGSVVRWNMSLATLQQQQRDDLSHTQVSKSELVARPYIEIKQGSEGIYEVKVVLDIKSIDEAVIKKSIIMMRNYKRLIVGKIEFGGSPT